MHSEQDGRATSLSDEVDGIVTAWHHERPDLDVEPLQVLSRVSRLAEVLDRWPCQLPSSSTVCRVTNSTFSALCVAPGRPSNFTAGELAAQPTTSLPAR